MTDTEKKHNIFGYIRVSTKEQNEDRQLIAMRELRIPERNLYIDKQSGKDFDRPQYKKLVRRLKKSGTMAYSDKRKERGHYCTGYAAFGHTPRQGSDGNFPERYCSASPVFRRGK